MAEGRSVEVMTGEEYYGTQGFFGSRVDKNSSICITRVARFGRQHPLHARAGVAMRQEEEVAGMEMKE